MKTSFNILLGSLLSAFLVSCGGSSGSDTSLDPLVGTWSVTSIDNETMPVAQSDGSTLDSIVLTISLSSSSPVARSSYSFSQTTLYSFIDGETTLTLSCEDSASLLVEGNTMTSTIETISSCVDQDGVSVDFGEGANQPGDTLVSTFSLSNNNNTLTITEDDGQVTVHQRV